MEKCLDHKVRMWCCCQFWVLTIVRESAMGFFFFNCQKGLNHFQKETSSLIEISENRTMKLRCKNYHRENCTFVKLFLASLASWH